MVYAPAYLGGNKAHEEVPHLMSVPVQLKVAGLVQASKTDPHQAVEHSRLRIQLIQSDTGEVET